MKQKKFDCDGRCFEELLNYSSWSHISKKVIDFEDCKHFIVKLISINKVVGKIQDCRNREEKNVEEYLLIKTY